MQQLKQMAAAVALGIAATSVNAAHHEEKDIKAIAKAWWTAGCEGLEEVKAATEKYMAEDGLWMADRYVGLGFRVNNEEGEEFGTVTMVMDGTPASKVLQAGDVFVSVNGMAMTYENRDKTTFRGAPGEAVKGVIRRGGKEMPVEITRGVIAVADSKADTMAMFAEADPEGWGSDSCKVLEVVAEGNVVYVFGEWTDTELSTGIKYTGRNVTRLEFNDEGEVVEGWDMGENRFVLEQLGYTITR
jgi:hypothetical protein